MCFQFQLALSSPREAPWGLMNVTKKYKTNLRRYIEELIIAVGKVFIESYIIKFEVGRKVLCCPCPLQKAHFLLGQYGNTREAMYDIDRY
jgi:hypothetical protein